MAADRVERVAHAIYMTHWQPSDENPRAQDHRFPPTWENASESVREWVRAQAVSAIAAADEPESTSPLRAGAR